MGAQLRLTVVMTSFNEIKNVEKAFESAKAIQVEDKEIIVMDNCSTDGTRELLQSYEKKEPNIEFVLKEHNYDWPHSYLLGLKMAKGRYTYIHHADNEYDYSEVHKMLEYAEKNDLDILICSRTKNFKGTRWELIKKRPEYLASIISTFLVNKWYGKNFTDIIGTQLLKTESIKKIPTTMAHHGFIFEFISRIAKSGLKMDEMAIGYTPRECKADKKIKWYNMSDALVALFKERYFSDKNIKIWKL